jgi:hypothetical protein
VDVPVIAYKDLSAADSMDMNNWLTRRFYDEKIYTNAQMPPRLIRKYCVLSAECEKIMENAITKPGFSARGYDRILKRNRTTLCATGRQLFKGQRRSLECARSVLIVMSRRLSH